jgi:hypothetical protein
MSPCKHLPGNLVVRNLLLIRMRFHSEFSVSFMKRKYGEGGGAVIIEHFHAVDGNI